MCLVLRIQRYPVDYSQASSDGNTVFKLLVGICLGFPFAQEIWGGGGGKGVCVGACCMLLPSWELSLSPSINN